MGRILRHTKNPLNPIVSTVGFEAGYERKVLLLGGWEQNPQRAAVLQDRLEENGIASASFSAFDTIDPRLDELALFDALSQDKKVGDLIHMDELISTLPPRMILRAIRLLDMAKIVLNEVPDYSESPKVVTHCAGANVYLLALLIEQMTDRTARVGLPSEGLLLEPMIAEGRRALTVGSMAAKHEHRAATNPVYISLQAMQHPDAPNLGTDRAKPLIDIVSSKGLTTLHRVASAGAHLGIVIGQRDYATTDFLHTDIAMRGTNVSVYKYALDHEGPRLGHGYALAQPERAAKLVARLIK